MSHLHRFGVMVSLVMLLPRIAAADDAEPTADYEVDWSASVSAAFHKLATREADEDVSGFFDQYRFTPDKEDMGKPEVGLTDALVDVYDEEQVPVLRLRLRSPTSNLALAPPDADHPFLNQHALVQSGMRGVFLDLSYDRLRTENLRQFPDPSGSALAFTDLTSPDDRFYKERTGFDGTIRVRPEETFTDSGGMLAALNGEVSLRGAYQKRRGRRQRSFIQSPTNDWLSIRQNQNQDVGTIGGSITISPGGLFTVALDVDHQRFREGASTLTDGRLGSPFPTSNRAIGFVPDTDRTTGALQIRRRFGSRAVIRAGVQSSLLQQVSAQTPEQRASGFGDNRLLFTSANLIGELQLTPKISANGFVKYDERRNEIDRSSALFNANGGTQVDEFVHKLQRITAGGELAYRIRGANRISTGVSFESVDRDLDFVNVIPAQAIVPANALVADETRMLTAFVRAQLQPIRGLRLRAELDYRDAPKTGYVIDLDEYFFGNVNASYVLSLSRPVMISMFAQGGTGKNGQFNAVGGVGPSPTGGTVDRNFSRSSYLWGANATASPIRQLAINLSFYQSRDAQDYNLILSDQARYFQNSFPLTFTSDGPIDYRADGIGIISGAEISVDEHTQVGLSYSFNRSVTRYRSSGPGGSLSTEVGVLNRIDADIHRVGVQVSRRIREGIRMNAGYRFDYYDDRSPVHGSGVVRAFGRGTYQHTLLFGVTMTNAVFSAASGN